MAQLPGHVQLSDRWMAPLLSHDRAAQPAIIKIKQFSCATGVLLASATTSNTRSGKGEGPFYSWGWACLRVSTWHSMVRLTFVCVLACGACASTIDSEKGDACSQSTNLI
jgi:hypothetical protein